MYSYDVQVSNKYGGNETLSGSVDLLNTRSQSVVLANQIQSKVSISVPSYKDITFTLNGTELPKKTDVFAGSIKI
jgi:hypothetical protein